MPAFQYLGGEYGKGLLESALAQPRQQFFGRYLYRTIYDKAAALFLSLIKNHPLLDGNKRLALASVTVFLALNGVLFYAARDAAVEFALRLATSGTTVNLKEIARWLRHYSISFGTLAMSDAELTRWWVKVRSETGMSDEESLRALRQLRRFWARLFTVPQ